MEKLTQVNFQNSAAAVH